MIRFYSLLIVMFFSIIILNFGCGGSQYNSDLGGEIKNLDPGYIDGELGRPVEGSTGNTVDPVSSTSTDNPSDRTASSSSSGGTSSGTTSNQAPKDSAADIAQKLMDKINRQRQANVTRTITFHVIGLGIAPENARSKGEAMIMGQNAARSDGYVKLVERIHGVYVDSYRRLGRGSIDQEVVHMETQAWLKGAEVLEYKNKDNGIYEAHMRLRIKVRPGHALYDNAPGQG